MKKQAYLDHFKVEKKHWWFVSKRRYIAEVLNSLKLSNTKILDFGCGTGVTTLFLNRWGSVIGIDRSELAVELSLKNGINAKKILTDSLPFINNSLDLITIFDVLYHKNVKPKKILQEALRVLKPGGHVLITDCALPSLWSEHDVIMEARERFKKTGLEVLVNNSGFKVIRSSYLFFLTFPLFYLSRKLSWLRINSGSLETNQVLSLVLKRVMQVETFIFKYLNLPIGSSLLVLAQKPYEKN